MQIQINTDHNIEGREGLATHVREVVEHALDHVRSHITRIEVHLGDENARKPGQDDMRCVMEAHLEHHQPVAVTEHANSLHQAIEGAVKKLLRMLESTLERHHEQSTSGDERIAADPIIPEA